MGGVLPSCSHSLLEPKGGPHARVPAEDVVQPDCEAQALPSKSWSGVQVIPAAEKEGIYKAELLLKLKEIRVCMAVSSGYVHYTASRHSHDWLKHMEF